MATTRNAILLKLQAGLLEVEGMHEDRVIIGAPSSDRARSNKHVLSIQWVADRGGRKDNNERERTLHVIVGANIACDRSQSDQQMFQLSEFYDLVHAKLEALSETDLGATVQEMTEEAPGIMPELDANDQRGFVGSAWKIVYHRTTATT